MLKLFACITSSLAIATSSLALAPSTPAQVTPANLLATARATQAKFEDDVYFEAEDCICATSEDQSPSYDIARAKTWMSKGRYHVKNETRRNVGEPNGNQVNWRPDRTIESLRPYGDEISYLSLKCMPPNARPLVMASPNLTEGETRIVLSSMDARHRVCADGYSAMQRPFSKRLAE